MLNSNDSAKVIKLLANDMIKREMVDIVQSMTPEARMDFVNSVRSLSEVSQVIEKFSMIPGVVVSDNNDQLSFITVDT